MQGLEITSFTSVKIRVKETEDKHFKRLSASLPLQFSLHLFLTLCLMVWDLFHQSLFSKTSCHTIVSTRVFILPQSASPQ